MEGRTSLYSPPSAVKGWLDSRYTTESMAQQQQFQKMVLGNSVRVGTGWSAQRKKKLLRRL